MPKRIMPLTDLQVKNAKPKDKEYKLSDGSGLYLLITPTGGKLWRYNYRFDGKEKTLFLKTYPEKTLDEARTDRKEARQLLANGVDPGAIIKALKDQKLVKKKLSVDKITFKQAQEASNKARQRITNSVDPGANEKALQIKERALKAFDAGTFATFENVARDWHEHNKSKWSDNHAERLLHRLELDIFPTIGNRPINEIERSELVNELRRIAARTVETAIRLKTAFYGIFRYALDGDLIKNNPAADLKGIVPKVIHKHMAAPTEPKKVAELLKAIDAFSGSYVTKCALQLTPLLFVRPGELRSMEWNELDLDAAEWNIPGHKMKMKNPHLVPLSTQAVDILTDLHRLTGTGKYVFPCHRSPLTCMSENTINASLRRLGFDKDEICAHGFRAMARTLLHEVLNFPPDAIEAQLAHAVPDRLGNAYNRTQFIAKRRQMMQVWSEYLEGLKKGAKVLPFMAKAA